MGEIISLLYFNLINKIDIYTYILKRIAYLDTILDQYAKTKPIVIYSIDNDYITAILIYALITGRKIHLIDSSISIKHVINIINTLDYPILCLSENYQQNADSCIMNSRVSRIITFNNDINVINSSLLNNKELIIFKEIYNNSSVFDNENINDFTILTTYLKSSKKLNEILITNFTYNDIWSQIKFYINHIGIHFDEKIIMIHLNQSRFPLFTTLFPIIINVNTQREKVLPLLRKPSLLVTTTAIADETYRESKILLLDNYIFRIIYKFWPTSKYITNSIKEVFLSKFGNAKRIIVIGTNLNYEISKLISLKKLPIDILAYGDNIKHSAYVPYDSNTKHFGEEYFNFNYEILYFSQIENALLELNFLEEVKIIKAQDKIILLIKPNEGYCIPGWNINDIKTAVEYYVREINSHIEIFQKIDKIIINPLPIPKDEEGNYLEYMYDLLNPHDD